MAREVASWVRQRPPAPRKVGRPEEAERPAPRRARMRGEDWRAVWKEGREVEGWEERVDIFLEGECEWLIRDVGSNLVEEKRVRRVAVFVEENIYDACKASN